MDSLPPELLQNVLCLLTVHDLRCWKATCQASSQSGRAALTTGTHAALRMTREVALIWSAICDDEEASSSWRGRARTLFKKDATAFVAGFEFWPREVLRSLGVGVLGDVLRYLSRTKVPIGSDIGLQVVLALVEAWEDMALAWCLLPAANRRKSAPQLFEIVPLLEDWGSVDKIATLLHAAVRMETDGHHLIRCVMEHWCYGHMGKAAAVVVRTVRLELAGCRGGSGGGGSSGGGSGRGTGYGGSGDGGTGGDSSGSGWASGILASATPEAQLWKHMLMQLRGLIARVHADLDQIWDSATSKWDAFFAAAAANHTDRVIRDALRLYADHSPWHCED